MSTVLGGGGIGIGQEDEKAVRRGGVGEGPTRLPVGRDLQRAGGPASQPLLGSPP